MVRSIVISMCFLATQAVAQNPGDLDLSFGIDGKVAILELDSVFPPHLVRTADLGSVVAFGQTVDGARVTRIVRLLEDGSIDPGFGVNGVVTSTTLGELRGLLQQSDGKLVIFGQTMWMSELKLERFLPNGEVDTSYGNMGQALFATGPVVSYNFVIGGLMLPDDRVVIHGPLQIYRFTSEGVLDTSFGISGTYPTGPGGGYSMAVTPAGRLRWTGPMWQQLSELDLDGQFPEPFMLLSTYYYQHSQGKALTVNSLSESIAQTWFSLGFPGTGGFGGYIIFKPSNANEYYPLGQVAWPLGLGGTTGHGGSVVGFDLGPTAVDQEDNFFAAYSFSQHYAMPNLPKAWVVRRVLLGTNDFDEGFGIDSNSPTTLNGAWTTFDTLYRPIPSSMVVAADGKVLVSGRTQVDGVSRVVLARYINIPDPRCRLDLKVYLGGALDTAEMLMHDDLRVGELLPSTQPYSLLGYTSIHGYGSWAISQTELAVEGPNAVVDWLWLELLSAEDTSTVVCTRLAIVHRDGRVTSADGHSPVDFERGAGTYFLRVRHRNHLSVTCSSPLLLGPDPFTLDLTDPAIPTFGDSAQRLVNGVHVMWPGDANANGQVKYTGTQNDRDKVLVVIGGTIPTATVTGYFTEDVNLDGMVRYTGSNNDRDIILQTIGGTVPTATRQAQGPE